MTPAGALAVALLVFAPTPAAAQYFGRSKVQYADFRFEVLKTPRFDVYFYPAERAAAEQAARLAERWYTRLSQVLQHELRGRQPLILYGSHPDFEQTNVVSGELGEGTGGVTEVLKRRVVLPLAGPLAETDHVIGHELVHAFQFDMTGERGGRFRAPGAARLPLWFIEGMAEYLSLGPVDPNTAMWLRDAAQRHELPTMRQLYDPRYFPYRYGQAFWAFICGRFGDGAAGEILRKAGRSGDAEGALLAFTGIPADSLALRWHAAVEAEYGPWLQATQPPEQYGRLLVGGGRDARLNVAPALSPDGSQVVFFSERDLFSIDLYLADARTGEIQRRIVKTALDPHYQSLEFINSAGAWDSNGRRIAFGAVTGGKAALTVLDVPSDRVEREIKLPDLGEVFNPTWSPDGRYIAFSALVGGFTDLFRYDLVENRLERLTDDAYADFEPAWSPDGGTIAFATDRFSTSFADLRAGNYRLALLDVASGGVRELPGFADGKNIDPQWAPDGRSVYFVSDHNGISNVYRLALSSGALFQVTDLQTGASGITGISPALSVAQRAGAMALSVYRGRGYDVYVVDSASVLAGTAVRAPPMAQSPAVLPPRDRVPSEVLAMLARADSGLPGDTAFVTQAYRPRFSLDYVSQPSLAVGVSSFGTFVGGGVGLYWSDMLGNRELVTALQINGGFKDISALVGYQNTRRRWNWGVVAQQVPFYAGAYGAAIDTMFGDLVYIEQFELLRQTNRELAVLAAYPFNTAQRVEFALGVQNIGFDAELETRATSLSTGVVYFDRKTSLPAPSAINLATASAALVYDNSFFGATSPILGQRYRLEADPTVGTIHWVSVLADYRRYVMPIRPFTLAARVLHYGRYGSGAADPRLSPLFLGYPSLVRGYDIGSFSASECPTDSPSCPVFDRLLGSRLLVGNVELRFPLLGVLHAGSGYYGAFPIEMALFADGGVAWTDRENASFFGGDRRPVTSAGAALRLNLFGFAIGELDVVRPFDRPGKGWYVHLSLTPGY
ncbi:MAG TPA: BamA/TamA family outer membrane protein [Gemmatimonadales bacterium]|nr:BamA/TamA family outer membrane protein [Gemmatimonadales bacterium]